MFNEFIEIITHTIFFIGLAGIIVGFIFSFVPIISQYRLPIQVLGILIFAWGVYLEGGLAKEKKIKQQVAELEVKLKEAEKKAEQVNTKIITQVVTKREVIKEKADNVIQYIDREVVKYDTTCPLPESVIKSHNAAALNKKIEDVVLTPTTIIETKVHNEATKPKSSIILPKK